MMIDVPLRFAVFRVDPEAREVRTIFPDGFETIGSREVNKNTLRDCTDLGYPFNSIGVWENLIEHELLHSVVSDLAWGRASLVMRHEAKAEYVPYFQRVHEEAVVLAMQRFLRTRSIEPALFEWRRRVHVWRPELERLAAAALRNLPAIPDRSGATIR